MTKIPTTEQLVNEDGTLDEGAAGQAIDAIMKQDLDEIAESKKVDNDTPADDDQIPSEDDSDRVVDDWVSSEDIQELVASLGYSDDVMSEFESPEEFERHVRLMDKELKRIRPGDEQVHALEADEISRQKSEKNEQVKWQHRENGKFAKETEELPQLDDTYEDDLREVVTARDRRLEELTAKISELEGKLDGTQQNALLHDFDAIVDELDMPELLGNSEELTVNERQNRARLWDEYKEMFNRLELKGERVTDKKVNRGIVLRALHLEFADEVKQQLRRNLTKKAKKQSAKIIGGKPSRSTKKYTGPVEKHPELLKAFEQMSAENG